MGSEPSKTKTLKTDGAMAVRGRCMCGDVRYEITGPMFDVVHCHCESCRRQSSAAFVTTFNIDKAHFRYTRGAPVLYKSSPGVERTHCGRCGSPISYENAREFSIFACTREDLTLVKPQAHIMVGEMLPWLEFGDDLLCFEKGLHGMPPIGHGPSTLPQVSVESVRANSEQTNATRDKFQGQRVYRSSWTRRRRGKWRRIRCGPRGRQGDETCLRLSDSHKRRRSDDPHHPCPTR